MLTLARSYLLGFSIYVHCRLRQLRHILPREQRQSLVSALIISRIDYCNAVLAGLPANTLAPLKRLLNACARFVANLKPRDHVTSTFQELHWGHSVSNQHTEYASTSPILTKVFIVIDPCEKLSKPKF